MDNITAYSILLTAEHNKQGDLIIRNSGHHLDENGRLVPIDIPKAYRIALRALEEKITKERELNV